MIQEQETFLFVQSLYRNSFAEQFDKIEKNVRFLETPVCRRRSARILCGYFLYRTFHKVEFEKL